jgi:integrase
MSLLIENTTEARTAPQTAAQKPAARTIRRKHAPFSLYRKETGEGWFWYARFWDESKGRYAVTRATGVGAIGKKGRKSEAEDAARAMLPSIFYSPAAETLTAYTRDFWREEHKYFREMSLDRGKPVAGNYLATAQSMVKNHISQYEPFNKISVLDLTPNHLRNFKLWMTERGASGGCVNKALQVIRTAARYVIGDNDTKIDPFTKIKPASAKYKEKGALTRAEVLRLLGAPSVDIRSRLAVLLGALCGMRMGEVRGLHWEDINFNTGIIHICHNYQTLDGIKDPKWDSFRDVPMPEPIPELLARYRSQRGNPAAGFVFTGGTPGKPLGSGFFRNAFIREVEAAGIPGAWHSRCPQPANYINQQALRHLSFHSLRHTFISHSRMAGLNSFQVQTLGGHKTVDIMEHYSHGRQIIETEPCRAALNNYFALNSGTVLDENLN